MLPLIVHQNSTLNYKDSDLWSLDKIERKKSNDPKKYDKSVKFQIFLPRLSANFESFQSVTCEDLGYYGLIFQITMIIWPGQWPCRLEHPIFH